MFRILTIKSHVFNSILYLIIIITSSYHSLLQDCTFITKKVALFEESFYLFWNYKICDNTTIKSSIILDGISKPAHNVSHFIMCIIQCISSLLYLLQGLNLCGFRVLLGFLELIGDFLAIANHFKVVQIIDE